MESYSSCERNLPRGRKANRSVATSEVGVKSDSEILDNFRLPAGIAVMVFRLVRFVQSRFSALSTREITRSL